MVNVLTNVGKRFVVDELATFRTYYIGWGTGAGTAGESNTTLFAESSEERVAARVTQPAPDIVQWAATITAERNVTITNAAVFNMSTAGTIIVKGNHAGISLAPNDKIEYTISIRFT